MDAALVSLVYDGSEEGVRGGLGYRHPERHGQPAAQHAKPYPAVLCYTVRPNPACGLRDPLTCSAPNPWVIRVHTVLSHS